MEQERVDHRDRDDPQRLAEEAGEQVAKHAADLRAARVEEATEPPTKYVP